MGSEKLIRSEHGALVAEFHEQVGHPVGTANFEDKEFRASRYGFLKEEFKELDEAYEAGDKERYFDALMDIKYFLLGDCVSYGWDEKGGFEEVHRGNMDKRFPDGTFHKRPEDGKVIKPEGYKPKDLTKFVR